MSKGELQRAILAFSLLYGSPLLAMDEPIFALEDRQKQRPWPTLRGWRARASEHLLLGARAGHLAGILGLHPPVLPGGTAAIGPTSEMFTREIIEKAYEVPFHMLKKREELYRKYLVELLRVRGEG